MKIVKVIASFFILMLIGIFISYGDTDNSGYDKFLETFNNTQADFKFYNIKANGLINGKKNGVKKKNRYIFNQIILIKVFL